MSTRACWRITVQNTSTLRLKRIALSLMLEKVLQSDPTDGSWPRARSIRFKFVERVSKIESRIKGPDVLGMEYYGRSTTTSLS
jgi:hypothetical protein